MKLARLLAHGLTLLNAVMGICAMLVLTLGPRMGWSGQSTLYIAALLITWAYLPDVLDGLVAKKWNATSEIGAQLDVNADTTTFNLATAQFIALTPIYSIQASPLDVPERLIFGISCALVYACAGLVRSARLVVSETPKAPVGRYFYGMTTNGGALLSTALVLVAHGLPQSSFTNMLYLIVPLQALFFAPLMISRIHFPDINQHLLKGLLPRWPLIIFVAILPFFGAAISWCGIIYLYAFFFPLGNALLRRPLR